VSSAARSDFWSRKQAALVVAHPGHELRLHHWLELTQPVVFVLTDGSGHTGQSRLASTTGVLAAAAARPGSIYGRFTDAGLYTLMREGNPAPFVGLARELAAALSSLEVGIVAGDALEGFNPSHDLCRYIINVAVSLMQQDTQRAPENYDFLLDGDPGSRPQGAGGAVLVELDDAALQRKLAAAAGYPELKAETAAALERFGVGAFRTECLRPVLDLREGLDRLEIQPPAYERFGEMRVRDGYYDHVIRYRETVQPLVRALWSESGVPKARTKRPAIL
jgi:hypothetical protein